VILVVSDSTGEVDIREEYIFIEDEVFGVIFAGFIFAYLFFICGIVFLIIGSFGLNLIVGGILAWKTYNKAQKYDLMKTANPYLIAHLIAGVIGFYFWPAVFFCIIAHFVIYSKFKTEAKRVLMMKRKKGKKKKKKT
jgi:hypothetical protein